MRKDPTLACLLNLLLVGTGHVYLGQIGKGIFIFALAIAFLTFGLAVANIPLIIWAMFDAYSIGKKMNQPAR